MLDTAAVSRGFRGLGVCCALLAILPACPALAVGNPAFTLEATPPTLVLGRDEVSTLVLKGPLDGRNLRLTCSGGTMRAVRKTGPQEWRAELLPPRSGEPNWLLCAAVSGQNHAELVLPLLRRELLMLAQLPPLSRVEVKIHDTLYGPVRANADGSAEVPVLLPPTARQAEVTATPAGKPKLVRSHPLSTQPTAQLLLIAPVTEVVADGTSSVPVWAFCANERGELADLPLTTTAADGALVLQKVATGISQGTFQPLARDTAGETTLAIRASSGRSATARLTLLGGVHPKVELHSPVRGLPADGVTTVNLEATVTDEQGHPLSGQPVRMAASSGTLSTAVERRPGVYSVSYTAPQDAGGQSVVTAELNGGARSEVTLALVPPPRITVEANPRQALGDGQSNVLLSITARGPDGRKLPDGSRVLLSSSRGTLPTEVLTRDGRAEVALAVGTLAGEAEIEARALDASARTTVRILPGAPTQLRVHPARPRLRCDGVESAEVRLRLSDAHDNAVEGIPVEVRFVGAGRTALAPELLRATGPGEFLASWRPPKNCDGGPLTVEAVALGPGNPGVSGSAQLWLQRDNVAPLALMASLGVQSALASELGSVFELEGARPLPLANGRLWGALSVHFARGVGWAPPAGDFWSGGLSAGPRLDLYRGDRLSAFVGLGVDAQLVRMALPLSSEGIWGATVGAHVRAGGGLRAGPGTVVLQARYELVQLETTAGLARSQAGLAVLLGYRITF